MPAAQGQLIAAQYTKPREARHMLSPILDFPCAPLLSEPMQKSCNPNCNPSVARLFKLRWSKGIETKD